MPGRRAAAVLDDLPDDIIVGKILMLLAPKDIGRCRMVRTSWRSATSTPEFMVEHRRRQPSLPIIHGNGNGRPATFVANRDAVATGASSQQIWPFLSRCRKSCCQLIRLHASSDGFLIVSRGARFYICNPTTRKHTLLPFSRPPRPLDDSYIRGLYQHKSTGEYRVLWSRHANVHKKEPKLSWYVLTVGDNESRCIQVIMPTLPWPSMEQRNDLIYYLHWPSPVHHGGNLHWLLHWPDHVPGSTGEIIVFDTEAESFRWMRNPAHEGRILNRLFNMEGMLAFLAMSTPDNTSMAVWVMKDCETETWALKYQIGMPITEASSGMVRIGRRQYCTPSVPK